MPLFEFALLQIPTEKEAKEGGKEKLLHGPEFVVAKDASVVPTTALLKAGDKIPKDADPDQIKVLIRPF